VQSLTQEQNAHLSASIEELLVLKPYRASLRASTLGLQRVRIRKCSEPV
jgi:hypothetical protein